MLNPSPTWEFQARKPLTRWFEHVRWTGNRVLGQWFCLDRATGAVHWERNLDLDEVVGISKGVVVANKRRRLSVGSHRYGCFGISLESGRVLWASPSSGLRDTLGLLLGRTDVPLHVVDDRCYCRSGRVLEIHSGRLLERLPKESLAPPRPRESETAILGRSRSLTDPVRLGVGNGRWLSHKLQAQENESPISEASLSSVWGNRLFLTDEEEGVLWDFNLDDYGYETCYLPYEDRFRYWFPYLYLLVCEKRSTRPQRGLQVYNPTRFHLLTLDVNDGSILQDIRVFPEPLERCRFEDLDETGALISDTDRKLLYFERPSDPAPPAPSAGTRGV